MWRQLLFGYMYCGQGNNVRHDFYEEVSMVFCGLKHQSMVPLMEMKYAKEARKGRELSEFNFIHIKMLAPLSGEFRAIF